MATSLRLTLILVILTGCAFATGYVAGWSKGVSPHAVEGGGAAPVASAPDQLPAFQGAAVQSAPETPPNVAPALPAAGPRSDSAARPETAGAGGSAPQRPDSAIQATPTASEAKVAPGPSASAGAKAAGATAPPPAARSATTPETAPGSPAAPGVTSAGGAPAIFVKESTHDFGTVSEGDTVREQFLVENRGKASLFIGKVSTSCGCTAALLSSNVIAPGESGQIDVTFRTQGYHGVLTKQIYLESNDPRDPRLVLKLTGTVNRDIDTTPQFVDFGTIAPGATISKTVRVASAQGMPFFITKLSASSPSVHFSELRKLSSGGYEFDVTVGPVPESRRLTSTIVIEMDSTRQPRLVMVLFGNIATPTQGVGK